MKKSVKALKVICFLLATILIAVDICIIVANCQNDLSLPAEGLSHWMKMIKDETLLKTVAIPGAHDAGTKGISYLAETQDRDTAELLACGTRYLDLRVAKAKDGLKIYHGPFNGVTLNSVLDSVKNFVANNPTETILLDFQHFDGDAQEETLHTVQTFFAPTSANSRLVENSSGKTDVEFVDSLTLGDCRGKCLVLWGGSKADEYGSLPYVFKRNNDNGTRESSVLHSYYQSELNKKSSSDYIKDALPHYLNLYKQQNSGLFVLQGQLTDGLFVFGPHFREATHNVNMNKYVQSLDDSEHLQIINIIIRDYVSPHKNCLTLKLNISKGIVAEQYANDFALLLLQHA